MMLAVDHFPLMFYRTLCVAITKGCLGLTVRDVILASAPCIVLLQEQWLTMVNNS